MMESSVLGEGQFGKVQRIEVVESRSDGRVKLKQRAEKIGKITPLELEILQLGVHEIPKLADAKISPRSRKTKSVTMQMAPSVETVEKKDLLNLATTIAKAVLGIKQTFRAKGRLKEGEDIVHHDIKPLNIGRTKGGKYKLLDWGSCEIVRPGCKTHLVNGGTLPYLPPESQGNVQLNTKFDSWSLGATLFKYATGESLFHITSVIPDFMSMTTIMPLHLADNFNGKFPTFFMKSRERYLKIYRAQLSKIEDDPELDPRVKDLIIGLLKLDPDERLGLEDVVAISEVVLAPSVSPQSTSMEPESVERRSRTKSVDDALEVDTEPGLSLHDTEYSDTFEVTEDLEEVS